MVKLFDKFWIFDNQGNAIYETHKKLKVELVDKFVKAVDIIAGEIKENFSEGTINLDKRTFTLVKISYINPEIKSSESGPFLFFFGMCDGDCIDRQAKMTSTLKKIIKQFLKLKIPYSDLENHNLENVLQNNSNISKKKFLSFVKKHLK